MIGLQGRTSRSESNRSVHLYKLARADIWATILLSSQRTTKALIRQCASWIMTQLISHLSLSTTKQTKWHVRAAKTQDSLGIRPVWSEALLCAVPSVGQRRLWPYWADAWTLLPLNFTFEWVYCSAAPFPHPHPSSPAQKYDNTRSKWQHIWNLKS